MVNNHLVSVKSCSFDVIRSWCNLQPVTMSIIDAKHYLNSLFIGAGIVPYFDC